VRACSSSRERVAQSTQQASPSAVVRLNGREQRPAEGDLQLEFLPLTRSRVRQADQQLQSLRQLGDGFRHGVGDPFQATCDQHGPLGAGCQPKYQD
jgi:hypothetical protein